MDKTENSITVLDRDSLQKELGLKGWGGRRISGILYRVLELENVNRTNARYSDKWGPDFAAAIIKHVGASYEIDKEQLENIPAEGGFITVSNHHYGSIDGMILTDVVARKRPDYKILTTFLLSSLPNLKDWFIPVNNLSSGDARTVSGIRAALTHLKEGKPLGLFPAGEVATWQKKGKRTAVGKKNVVEDLPWADNMMKLIRRSGLPVIPIYFSGGNSRNFHILGRIHPLLRTVRLPHEMFNKKGCNVLVRIGKPIHPEELAAFDDAELGMYLRNRCYALEAQCDNSIAKKESVLQPLAAHVPAEIIRAQIEAAKDKMLYESGDYRAYLLSEKDAPDVLHELYRLREETFRAVGEGTSLPIDTDEFDKYYKHLILWSVPGEDIVGAYRIGYGSEIIAEHGGEKGFYSSTLVKFGPKAPEVFAKSIELGRSFIVEKYQREVLALKMMLAGLCVAATKDSTAEYFTGPVSMSNSLPHFYKSLAVWYLKKNYSLPDGESIATSNHDFIPDFLSVNPDQLLMHMEGGIDGLDHLIGILSDNRYRLPVLMRKYFNGGAKVICFNVDPLFSSSLDGHILLPISGYPVTGLRSYVRSLPKELQDAVFMRFYGTTNP